MNLPKLSPTFTLEELQKTLPEILRLLERADKDNRKTTGDIEMANTRLIFTDTVDGTRYALSIASGAGSVDPV